MKKKILWVILALLIVTIPAQADRPVPYKKIAASGNVQAIAEVVLLSNATSITVPAVPQTFRHLRIIGQARSTRDDASSTDEIYLQFNDDTGANYDRMRGVMLGNDTHTFNASRSQNSIWVTDIAAAHSPANYADMFTVDIANYRGAFYKAVLSDGATISDGSLGAMWRTSNAGWWRSTAPVTSITLFSFADAFAAGSTFTLYGIP